MAAATPARPPVVGVTGRWIKWFPAAEWVPALRDPRVLRTEALTGFYVALILIPQAVAYAQLAGLPPQAGLYAACLPVIIAALFGVARPLQAGPTALISLMTAAALAPIVSAGGTAWIVYALTLAFLVGVFQFGFGLLRLGQLVNFLANPVVAGFTTAAAVIIGTSQLGVLFRIDQPRDGWHFLGVARVIADIPHSMHLPTVLLALLTAAIIILIKRAAPRLPAYLIALATATLVAWGTGFERAGGAVIGVIPTGFPMLSMPSLAPWIIADLLVAAVIIALIAFVETATVTRTLAARSRQALDLDREMIGQGLANMTAGVAQGYPISGSLARSHYAWTAGARTGFASLVAGLVVGATIVFAAPLFTYMPRAALAVVIIFAIGGLFSFTPLKRALRAHRQDGVTGIVTFVVALLVAPALHQAVLIGVALSLGLFLYRSMRPHALSLGRHPDGTLRNAVLYKLPPCEQITVLRFDGPLYFANAGHFADNVLAALSEKASLKYVVVDCSGIAEMDATGEQVLASVQRELQEAGVVLMLAAVRSTVRDVLVRTRLLKTIGLEHVYRDTDTALEWAWQRLEPGHRDRCPLRLYPTS